MDCAFFFCLHAHDFLNVRPFFCQLMILRIVLDI
jgi:hypothetical protein